MDSSAYYKAIARYYDADAADFERRYDENPALQKIRGDFRRITEHYPFRSALEIGCGPGIDLAFYGRTYPDRQFAGIDVSPGMVSLAQKNIAEARLSNVTAKAGSQDDLAALFPGRRFDLIFVYFGALNTVADLRAAVKAIHASLAPGGTLVFTSVNRFYVLDALLNLARGKIKKALARFTDRWRGYSPVKQLESRCYSAGKIKRVFASGFTLVEKKGYSIFYPAWYRLNHLRALGPLAGLLWAADAFINKTPFWNTGEYSLYVFKAVQLRPSMRSLS